jgi:hypothetical protein
VISSPELEALPTQPRSSLYLTLIPARALDSRALADTGDTSHTPVLCWRLGHFSVPVPPPALCSILVNLDLETAAIGATSQVVRVPVQAVLEIFRRRVIKAQGCVAVVIR